jgi:hypothetical protein
MSKTNAAKSFRFLRCKGNDHHLEQAKIMIRSLLLVGPQLNQSRGRGDQHAPNLIPRGSKRVVESPWGANAPAPSVLPALILHHNAENAETQPLLLSLDYWQALPPHPYKNLASLHR